MNLIFYLVVKESGVVKTCKSKPSLKNDEISIRIQMQIPNALFQKPILSANIIVPHEAVHNKIIEPQIKDNIKDAIQQAAGMEVKINFVDQVE